MLENLLHLVQGEPWNQAGVIASRFPYMTRVLWRLVLGVLGVIHQGLLMSTVNERRRI